MSKKGFSLIEIAIVMIIIGLLLGMGVSLMGTLVKRAKYKETEEVVKSAKEGLITYASNAKCIDINNLNSAVRKFKDAYGKDIAIILAKEVFSGSIGSVSGTCDPVNAPICGRRHTTLKVESEGHTYDNVSFVLVSGGANYNIQTGNDNLVCENRSEGGIICTDNDVSYGTVKVYIYDDPDKDDFNFDMHRKEKYDDIVQWVNLNELRAKIGCSQKPLHIITLSLPIAYQGSLYNARIYADGGVPYSNKKYSWTWNSTNEDFGDNKIKCCDEEENNCFDLPQTQDKLCNHLKVNEYVIDNLLPGTTYQLFFTVEDSEGNKDSKYLVLNVDGGSGSGSGSGSSGGSSGHGWHSGGQHHGAP
ncbi:MAG: prepilin-type N-terminal cleavage/methylation domain-containing protein [Desulfonauticus sp.]|nr:prepilin-type N-terminal cleavage/methylation domain-containing protein [Desulfonauticus sp.]